MRYRPARYRVAPVGGEVGHHQPQERGSSSTVAVETQKCLFTSRGEKYVDISCPQITDLNLQPYQPPLFSKGVHEMMRPGSKSEFQFFPKGLDVGDFRAGGSTLKRTTVCYCHGSFFFLQGKLWHLGTGLICFLVEKD